MGPNVPTRKDYEALFERMKLAEQRAVDAERKLQDAEKTIEILEYAAIELAFRVERASAELTGATVRPSL